MSNLHKLQEMGQSPWLNHMRRNFIRSGELRQRVEEGVQGITLNAAVFEKTLTISGDYDEAIRQHMLIGTPVKRVYEALMTDDAQQTADCLHQLFTNSHGLNGFVSLELDPALSQDEIHTVASVRHLLGMADRENVMAEIPATAAGVKAIRTLVGEGVSINATHIFSIELYEQVAEAYISGLEYYFHVHSVWRKAPTAVASFSVNVIDQAVDKLLQERGAIDLVGKTAIAMSKLLYQRFCQIFSGSRWQKLASRGARVLRPKWTRTSRRDFRFSDTMYVEALIGADTVTTFSPSTLNAFLDHGVVANRLTENLDEAEAHLARLAELGIDLTAVTNQLQKQHLLASDKRFQSVTTHILHKRSQLDEAWQPMAIYPGSYQKQLDSGLQTLSDQRVMCRIWQHDHTVWQSTPTGIVNRLGWLHIIDNMEPRLEQLHDFLDDIRGAGFTHALLIGLEDRNLAPEVFYTIFGKPGKPPYLPHPYLDLAVLKSADSDAIYELTERLPLERTLSIVATKSGDYRETLFAFEQLYQRMVDVVGVDRAGEHFVAITDADSSLIDVTERYHFRTVFLNDPDIDGRFSPLSYFGLVPAVLVGADLTTLLARAAGMAANSETFHSDLIHDNLAARLGTMLGVLIKDGRDKVTLITSLALQSFGDWVGQLICESIGITEIGVLSGVDRSIVDLEMVGNDTLFVHLRLQADKMHDEAVRLLIDAGHPVILLNVKDLYDVGGQIFLWEMATAVTAHFLSVNPFAQPSAAAVMA